MQWRRQHGVKASPGGSRYLSPIGRASRPPSDPATWRLPSYFSA
jgi:hypothetical protein